MTVTGTEIEESLLHVDADTTLDRFTDGAKPTSSSNITQNKTSTTSTAGTPLTSSSAPSQSNIFNQSNQNDNLDDDLFSFAGDITGGNSGSSIDPLQSFDFNKYIDQNSSSKSGGLFS
jgi:hypothetical protein